MRHSGCVHGFALIECSAVSQEKRFLYGRNLLILQDRMACERACQTDSRLKRRFGYANASEIPRFF
jgi:hypothetical protein